MHKLNVWNQLFQQKLREIMLTLLSKQSKNVNSLFLLLQRTGRKIRHYYHDSLYLISLNTSNLILQIIITIA